MEESRRGCPCEHQKSQHNNCLRVETKENLHITDGLRSSILIVSCHLTPLVTVVRQPTPASCVPPGTDIDLRVKEIHPIRPSLPQYSRQPHSLRDSVITKAKSNSLQITPLSHTSAISTDSSHGRARRSRSRNNGFKAEGKRPCSCSGGAG